VAAGPVRCLPVAVHAEPAGSALVLGDVSQPATTPCSAVDAGDVPDVRQGVPGPDRPAVLLLAVPTAGVQAWLANAGQHGSSSKRSNDMTGDDQHDQQARDERSRAVAEQAEARERARNRLRPPDRTPRRRTRDERVGHGFRFDPAGERLRERAAAGERLTPALRMALGHYSAERDAAERLGILEQARERAEGTR